jgi:hypothetical protein
MTRMSAILLYCVYTLPIIYEKDHHPVSVYLFLFNYKIAETYCIKSPPDNNGGFLFYTGASIQKD